MMCWFGAHCLGRLLDTARAGSSASGACSVGIQRKISCAGPKEVESDLKAFLNYRVLLK